MRVSALPILQDYDPSAVAGAVTALVGDGRRVLATAATAAELADVRAALRADVVDRGLDVLPDLTPSELRELRRLLVTGSADRAARARQQLPSADRVPHPGEVAELCARAENTAPPGPAAAMVPELLAGIDRVRREAVTSVARYVHRSMRAMYPRVDRQWAWDLLGELIYSRHRPAFDQLLEDTAQAVRALERARHLPSVTVVAPLPPGALSILRRYGEFLFGGGRARAYLRAPAERRDAMPVLRLLRVDGQTPQTAEDVRRGVEHLELGERLSRIDLGCTAIGIPAPRDERELGELADGLVRVAAAARSVGALRHDVLFLADDSPLAVPDVDTAEQVAAAILHYAEHGTHIDACRRLDRMAEELAAACPTLVPTSEHEAAVRALRAHDATAYAAAVDAVGAARRQAHDARRQIALLDRLQANAPRLAVRAARPAAGERPAVGRRLGCARPARPRCARIRVPAADRGAARRDTGRRQRRRRHRARRAPARPGAAPGGRRGAAADCRRAARRRTPAGAERAQRAGARRCPGDPRPDRGWDERPAHGAPSEAAPGHHGGLTLRHRTTTDHHPIGRQPIRVSLPCRRVFSENSIVFTSTGDY
jgi:hypothetical protein